MSCESSKILFVLKRREGYNLESGEPKSLSTGLYNSATLVKDMLVEQGYEAELEIAIDNNCIDRLVTEHKPAIVIIEALWVVPEKFEVLTKLHPNVQWVIRLHSEVPFMAQEGIAYEWIRKYIDYDNIYIGVNSPRMFESLSKLDGRMRNFLLYMPNYYPVGEVSPAPRPVEQDVINIGCFGAIRPLKNHIQQAIAAIDFADGINKRLRFHINGNRVEGNGDPVLKNIIAIFDDHPKGHELICHEWKDRAEFLRLCYKMDIGMQVSFSETFNIVAADVLMSDTPIVVSPEIPWATSMFAADPTDHSDIVRKLRRARAWPSLNKFLFRRNLDNYSQTSINDWKEVLKDIGVLNIQ